MNNPKQVLNEAVAAHEGDRQALLAAINEAAANMNTAKRQAPSEAGSSLMKKSQVNANVARDLVSNANSRVADMNDFIVGGGAPRMSAAEQFEHGKTLLNNRAGLDSQSRKVEEDLRSLRSEFDYGSKKKFVDVLGNVSAQTKLNRMRAQHEMENAGGPSGLGSSKSRVSYKSYMSRQSKASRMSKQSVQ